MRTGYRTALAAALLLGCAAASAQGGARALRVLDDPWTGIRWQLAADPDHPGGPGRLLPGSVSSAVPQVDRPAAPSALIIRAGDRLLVEESAAGLHARYTAVAMAPAVRGGVFLARLAVSGRAVRVVATAPGRAELVPASFSDRDRKAQP